MPEPAALETPESIPVPYLLVTQIPVFDDARGGIWLDRLWHTDLSRHLSYLHDFTLAAPRHAKPAKGDLVRLEPPAGTGFALTPLPRMDSRLRALLHVPSTIAAIWRAVGAASVVHASMGGWPYPLALVATPIARLRGRKAIVVVESAPWRHTQGTQSLARRFLSRLTEAAVRRAVALADLAIFTNRGYQRSLSSERAVHGHVIPASWIREEDIVPREEAEALWRDKVVREPRERRFLFAGRLTVDKGIEVLLAAAAMLESRGIRFRLDLIGEGPLLERCRNAAAQGGTVKIRVLPVLPYGDAFLSLLRACDAVIVPSLADEQPRVVFDSWSQAVPVLAADTSGLHDLVEDGVTGWRFPPADASALASVLQRALADPRGLSVMGLRGREQARRATHAHMHAERSRLIRRMLG